MQASLRANLAVTNPYFRLVRQAHADQIGGTQPDAPLISTERQELSLLRRQFRQVQTERDILAKSTAWFANKDSDENSTR